MRRDSALSVLCSACARQRPVVRRLPLLAPTASLARAPDDQPSASHAPAADVSPPPNRHAPPASAAERAAPPGPNVGADRRARRRLQLSLRLPPRRAAHRRGAGAARPDVRAADRRPLPDHRHALPRASTTATSRRCWRCKLDPGDRPPFRPRGRRGRGPRRGHADRERDQRHRRRHRDPRRRPRPRRAATRSWRRIEARLAGRHPADERSRLEYRGAAVARARSARSATSREAQQEIARDHADGVPLRLGRPRPRLRRPTGPSARPGGARSTIWRELGLGAMIVAITLAPWILLGLLLWWAAMRSAAAGSPRRRAPKPAPPDRCSEIIGVGTRPSNCLPI